MRRSPVLCPVHLYARKKCGKICAGKRRKLAKLSRDFRVFWYDRRRGLLARHYGRKPRVLHSPARDLAAYWSAA
jgi:hypothetical protein